MSNYFLLFYPAILLFITFWGCSIPGKGKFSEHVWDREQSKMFQASACIGVILHHVTQIITAYGQINRGPITLLASMGILFTSVYFFFSGYGLIISVRSNNAYLDTFLQHRLPTILVPFFSANLISVLLRIFYSRIPMNASSILQCIFGYRLLNGNGWYIVEIFFLYLIFYLLFKFVKKQDLALLFMCLAAVLLILFSLRRDHSTSPLGDEWFRGEWWFNSTIVFVMGALTARFKDAVLRFTKKHYLLLLLLTTICFLVSFIFEERIRNTYGYYRIYSEIGGVDPKVVTLLAQSVLCILSTALVLMINLKITMNNKVLRFLSSISMEIFLLHGIFVNTLFSFKGVHPFLIYAIVIVCSIPAAFLMHKLNAVLLRVLPKIWAKTKAFMSIILDDTLFFFSSGHAGEKKKRNPHKILVSVCITLLVLILLSGVSFSIYRMVLIPNACKNELELIKNANVGDCVFFGHYDSDYETVGKEKTEWIVLKKDNDRVLLISKYGLTGSTYNTHHEEISWSESSLAEYLNNTMYNEMFNRYEKEALLPNPESNDYVSLLSAAEAALCFTSDPERQLELTNVAKAQGTNVNSLSKVNYWDVVGYRSSWWWLRGENKSLTAPIVSADGEILTDKKYVNKPNGAVRPVIWIDLSTP